MRAVEKKQWYVTVKDKATRIDRAIYRHAYDMALAMIPKIQMKSYSRGGEGS